VRRAAQSFTKFTYSMSTTLARRIFLAHLELSYTVGRKVTLAEFGQLVAKQLRREAPFSAAAVSRWEAGTQIPSADVIEAIAAVTGTDPGWISHGNRSAAPAPRLIAANDATAGQRSSSEQGTLEDPPQVDSERVRETKLNRHAE
jgi:transcriptional regulator with XRE-family HTH domain